MSRTFRNYELRHASEEVLCISRKRWGRGYQYFNEENQKIRDEALLKRFRKLVIPPMWTEVRICKWDDGHIQAIGRDAKGRRQYIYHSEWERQRQQEKFSRMTEFGMQLPAMRERAYRDLRRDNWSLDKVCALMLLILDETGIRVGNKQYASRNDTYGLTTLRRRHLQIHGDEHIVFSYKGKSSKEREVEVDDADLAGFIKKCAEMPGYQIFRYRAGAQKFQDVDSDDLNNYIRDYMKGDFSSKDFRTWSASRMAIEFYPRALERAKSLSRVKFTNVLLRLVADELGNTPSICRDYYIHPKILRCIEKREIPDCERPDGNNEPAIDLSSSEKMVIELIA